MKEQLAKKLRNLEQLWEGNYKYCPWNINEDGIDNCLGLEDGKLSTRCERSICPFIFWERVFVEKEE